MNYFEYQKRAITTKIYEDEVALSYLALGLGGEAVELFEKIQENRSTICELSEDQLRLINKEIGDVYWYVAGLAEETDQDLLKLIDNNKQFLVPDIKLDEVISTLIIETGTVLEIFKKSLRDDYSLFKHKKLTSEKFEKMNRAIAGIVATLEYLCNFFEIAVEDVLLSNVTKLESRAKRGVIGGSGDER